MLKKEGKKMSKQNSLLTSGVFFVVSGSASYLTTVIHNAGLSMFAVTTALVSGVICLSHYVIGMNAK
jgi:hypothetical protein